MAGNWTGAVYDELAEYRPNDYSADCSSSLNRRIRFGYPSQARFDETPIAFRMDKLGDRLGPGTVLSGMGP
jgi:hypothetical protein